jgi:hypothetical protein
MSNRFLPAIELSFSDIERVEADFGFGGGLRFRTAGQGNGTVFWALRKTKPAVVDALRKAGVAVKS